MGSALVKLMETRFRTSSDAILDLPPSDKPDYENLLLGLGYRVQGIALRE
jgi:hypothetical protein